jgi:hypothetical protein
MRLHFVARYLKFGYLSRTAANLALTTTGPTPWCERGPLRERPALSLEAAAWAGTQNALPRPIGKGDAMPRVERLEVISSRADLHLAAGDDPVRIATRLGLPVDIVRKLQARGILVHLELSDREVRERLWQAHLRRSLPNAGQGSWRAAS